MANTLTPLYGVPAYSSLVAARQPANPDPWDPVLDLQQLPYLRVLAAASAVAYPPTA